MPKVDLRELWEGGLALDDAWIDLGLAFHRATWRILNRHPDVDDLDDPKYAELGAWLPSTFETRQMKLRTIMAGEHVYLLDRLYRGEFWAIGCQSKPNYSDEYVRVPRHLFFVDRGVEPEGLPDVTWTRGEIRNADEAYFDIRVVVPAHNAPSASPAPSSESGPVQKSSLPALKKKGGRPPTYPGVEKLVSALKKDSAFMAMATREDQAREVRAQLRGEEFRYKDQMAGYKTETIVRWIGEILAKKSDGQTG